MAILIKISFLSGRYHATVWGRNVNEGVAEWPPSPWRFLRALVATWRRKCPELGESEVRRVLEQLVQPPRFHLPPARVAHVRYYLPWEKKGPQDRTLVFDTFVVVAPDQAVSMYWPEARLEQPDHAILERLLANLTTLGRAESWVQAALAPDADSLDCNCYPAQQAAANQELVAVFCPDPDTAFASTHYPLPHARKGRRKTLDPKDYLFDCPRWHLCLDTQILQEQRWPNMPGARWQWYVRPAEALAAPARELAMTPGIQRTPDRTETVARFLLDGAVLPSVTDVVRVAEACRRALMSQFARWCRRHPERAHHYRRPGQEDAYSSPTFSGKDHTGTALKNHLHAYYLPTAEGADPRRITHITVFARAGFSAEEVAALSGLRALAVPGVVEEHLRCQLVGLGKAEDFTAALLQESAEWVSATPFVGPAHIGRRQQQRYLLKALRRELRRWLERQYPGQSIQAAPASITLGETPAQLPALEYRRARQRRSDDGYHRPCGFFRLTFVDAAGQPVRVRGPICLGYGSHFGLGLFLPRKS